MTTDLTVPDELTVWVAETTGLTLEPWQARRLALLIVEDARADHPTPRQDEAIATAWVRGLRAATVYGLPPHDAVDFADHYASTGWQALGVAMAGLADALLATLRPALSAIGAAFNITDDAPRLRRAHHHARKHTGRPRPRNRPGRRRRR